MERQPLTYIETFERHDEFFDDTIGIKPERLTLVDDGCKRRCYKRELKLQFTDWGGLKTRGPRIVFTIVDYVFISNIEEQNGHNRDNRDDIQTVWRVDIYGCKAPKEYHKDEIIPSLEQVLMMESLVEGEVLGNTADRMVSALYCDMILMNPKSRLADFMPELREHFCHVHMFHGGNMKTTSK